jgi:hypothetical protein
MCLGLFYFDQKNQLDLTNFTTERSSASKLADELVVLLGWQPNLTSENCDFGGNCPLCFMLLERCFEPTIF